jgi:predicted RNA-binding Zn-ribbon protein involved in translation (DUF1610 family)
MMAAAALLVATAAELTPNGRQEAVARLVREGKLKRCPRCGEAIQTRAKVCRFCGQAL